MEETPDSGLAEEIQRSQIDIGAFTWDPDASTESVQKMTPSESQEDFACVSEARQDRFPTRMLSSTDASTVAAQSKCVLEPGGNEQMSPKPMPEAGVAITACVEINQPCDSEVPGMNTAGLPNEGHEDTERSDKEGEKQKTEDSVWAGVETCQKVDARAVDVQELQGSKEFAEEVCGHVENRIVVCLKAVTKQAQDAHKISDQGMRCKQSMETHGPYFEEAHLFEKDDVGSVAMVGEPCDGGQRLHDRVEIIINGCKNMEGSGAQPDNYIDALSPCLQTDSVFDNKDACAGGCDLPRKDIKENVIDAANCALVCPAAQGSADAEEIQCGIILSTSEGAQDKNQAIFVSMKYAVAVQCKTSFNYSLEMNDSTRHRCLLEGGDSLEEWLESTATENCSQIMNMSGVAKTDCQGVNADQIRQLNLNLSMSNVGTSGCSDIPHGQASGFANWLGSNHCWPIRDGEGFDHSCAHLDVVGNQKGLTDTQEEQATASCSEQSQEIVRPLALGTFWNISTESSDSSRDSDTNNSELSEDEIANQRYGLLYQEIEADKDEVPTPICSLV
ncbi:uncharacterized protein RHO17_009013 [Thomomys bottae]